MRHPAHTEPERPATDSAAALIDAREPVPVGGRAHLDVGARQLVAVADQSIHGRGRHVAPGIGRFRAREELERRDRVLLRERDAQPIDGKQPAEIKLVLARLVLRRHAGHRLPLARRGDSRVAGLDREAGEPERAGATRPRDAQILRPPGRHLDPELLEARAPRREPHHRSAARELSPLPQVVAGLDRHTREDLIGAGRQLERDRPDRLVERARVGQVADELRIARRPALACAQVDDRPVAALLEP